jgi:hypothetical protein
MIGCAVGTLVLMALTWNVGAHPQLGKADPLEPGEPSGESATGLVPPPPLRAEPVK